MKKFQNILVHVDSRRDEQALVDRAIELAKAHGAVLKLVDVVPEFSWPVRVAAPDYNSIRQAVVQQKEATVAKLVERARASGLSASLKILFGKTSDQILAEVASGQHDLVMKDAKGQFSHSPGVFGTTALKLMRACPCPVWAYRPCRSSGLERVLVAIDASTIDDSQLSLSRHLVEWGASVSVHGRADIAHVWSIYGESLIRDYMKRDEFDELVKETECEAREHVATVLEPFGIAANDPRIQVLRGDAADQLIQFVKAKHYDVLVIGTVGRTGISGLLIGNTAETLLNRVECSVIAIKPPA